MGLPEEMLQLRTEEKSETPPVSGGIEGLAQGHSAKKMLNWANHNLGV